MDQFGYGDQQVRRALKKLEEMGTATVMPLGSPIGSNRGVNTRDMIKIIILISIILFQIIKKGLSNKCH